jgi:hypothetical protein
MKSLKLRMVSVFLVIIVGILTIGAAPAFAAYYYHANGGAYWTQSGSGWTSTSNDGYCISGRGPCGSNLWYFQSNMNHGGCGYDAYGHWDISNVTAYDGVTSAWIDGEGGGTMYGAGYGIAYNYGSGASLTINQNNYSEEFAPLGTYYRTSDVNLHDGWGPAYACNSLTGYRVEFDEVRLDV